jgi:hypothetical protein
MKTTQKIRDVNKKVLFSSTNLVHYCKDDIDRRLSSSYYRGIVKKCFESQQEIFLLLNKLMNKKLDPLSDGVDEDPLKIYNEEKEWDNDESPVLYLQYIRENPPEILKVINALERFSERDVVITISLECFESSLTVKMSGNSSIYPPKNYFIMLNYEKNENKSLC